MSNLFIFLHGLSGINPFLDTSIIFFARYFQYIVMAYAGVLVLRQLMREAPPLKPLLFIKAGIKEAFWVTFATSIAMFITYILKNAFAVPRPFLAGATPLFYHGGYNSFPSGHATFFAALFTAMFFYHKRRGWWFFAAAILIGASRVIAGIHYPIDIFVGYIIGFSISLLVIKALRPYLRKKLVK